MSLKSRVRSIEDRIPTRSECTLEDEIWQQWMALPETERAQKLRNYVAIYRRLCDKSIQTIEDVWRFVNAPEEDVRSYATRGTGLALSLARLGGSGLSEEEVLQAGKTREGLRRWPSTRVLSKMLGCMTTKVQ